MWDISNCFINFSFSLFSTVMSFLRSSISYLRLPYISAHSFFCLFLSSSFSNIICSYSVLIFSNSFCFTILSSFSLTISSFNYPELTVSCPFLRLSSSIFCFLMMSSFAFIVSPITMSSFFNSCSSFLWASSFSSF